MNNDQKKLILQFVRETASGFLTGKHTAEVPDFADSVPFGGVFITFRKAGELRGCMGTLGAEGAFSEVLINVTRSSLIDPRFTGNPITADELSDLDITVSVLGPIELVPAPPKGLEAGIHGIVVSRGLHRGCFLPQVASDQGWDVEQFLSECCTQKAGLPPDAWRDTETMVERFEAELLEERQKTRI